MNPNYLGGYISVLETFAKKCNVAVEKVFTENVRDYSIKLSAVSGDTAIILHYKVDHKVSLTKIVADATTFESSETQFPNIIQALESL